MQSSMSNEPGKRSRNPSRPAREDDPDYRVYRAGRPDRADPEQRPYTLYRSGPRGLRERLGGEQAATEDEQRLGRGRGRSSRGGDGGGPGGGGSGGGGRSAVPGAEPGRWRRWRAKPTTPLRVLKWVVLVVIGWLVLSLVLFLVSAQIESGSGLPKSAQAALHSGPNMVTGTDTILVIGTDQRPKGSNEPGAFAGGIRSDTIMLWRIGGGTSRRLSIPRDTVVPIPGYGSTKVNAAYSYGGPALAIRTIQNLTGVRINHLIVVNLANFPKFIDAIGGVNVTTGRICSEISGGAKNGGFSLFLAPGTHHLDGRNALTLARTRENRCNVASNDLTREAYQQKILNSIKSQLLSPGIVPRLPWAAWDAPQAVRTDMGGPTLMTLFLAAEIGGSSPTRILGQNNLPLSDVQSSSGQAAIHRAVTRLMTGH